MHPAYLLLAVAAITLIASVIEFVKKGKQNCELQRIARANGMHFSTRDQLRLTPRVAANFPIPGAAAVQVKNLIYCGQSTCYKYVFTAEYTTGVFASKKRTRRVAAFNEPKDRAAQQHFQINLADPDLKLVEQYESLMKSAAKSESLVPSTDAGL